jgi:hypothetical protein
MEAVLVDPIYDTDKKINKNRTIASAWAGFAAGQKAFCQLRTLKAKHLPSHPQQTEGTFTCFAVKAPASATGKRHAERYGYTDGANWFPTSSAGYQETHLSPAWPCKAGKVQKENTIIVDGAGIQAILRRIASLFLKNVTDRRDNLGFRQRKLQERLPSSQRVAVIQWEQLWNWNEEKKLMIEDSLLLPRRSWRGIVSAASRIPECYAKSG